MKHSVSFLVNINFFGLNCYESLTNQVRSVPAPHWTLRNWTATKIATLSSPIVWNTRKWLTKFHNRWSVYLLVTSVNLDRSCFFPNCYFLCTHLTWIRFNGYERCCAIIQAVRILFSFLMQFITRKNELFGPGPMPDHPTFGAVLRGQVLLNTQTSLPKVSSECVCVFTKRIIHSVHRLCRPHRHTHAHFSLHAKIM